MKIDLSKNFKLKRLVIIIIIFLLLFISFLVRLIPLQEAHWWDETVYLLNSKAIFQSNFNNYNELDFRPPLLSILFGLGFYIWDSVYMASLIVALLNTLGVIFIYLLTDEIYNSKIISSIAALLFAFNPFLVDNSRFLLTDVPSLTLIIISFYFFVKFFKSANIEKKFLEKLNKNIEENSEIIQDSSLKYLVLSGFFMSLAILMRFTSLIILFVFVFYFILFILKALIVDLEFLYKRNKITYGSFFSIYKYKFSILSFSYLIYFLMSIFVIFLPYLVWNTIKFGFPFFTFFRAQEMVISNFVPFSYYLNSMIKIFNLILLGSLFFTLYYFIELSQIYKSRSIIHKICFSFLNFKSFFKKVKKESFRKYFSLILSCCDFFLDFRVFLLFILVFYLFYIFLMPHKEARYLIPLFLPFVILGSEGYYIFFKKYKIPIILKYFSFIFLLISFVYISIPVFSKLSGPYLNTSSTREMQVSYFLKSHYDINNSIIFTYYNYPVFAFYSNMKVFKLSSFNFLYNMNYSKLFFKNYISNVCKVYKNKNDLYNLNCLIIFYNDTKINSNFFESLLGSIIKDKDFKQVWNKYSIVVLNYENK